MRVYWELSIFAFIVLGVSAVWMGGLNQDEGWYLYAANLVAEGKMLYKDFFYTQGPSMPSCYKSFTWIWQTWGLLGARIFTLMLGSMGILIAMGIARRLAPVAHKSEAMLITFMLLGCNLYHLYYVSIPKTYALASLLVMIGFFLLIVSNRSIIQLAAGFAFAYATGTRISLGVLFVVVGLWFIFKQEWRSLIWFAIGGVVGLIFVYGPYLVDAESRAGLLAAQQYHTARSGFDLTWVVGSVSRLVRWYLPIFIVLGLGIGKEQALKANVLLCGFIAVFALQIIAPFPYEDYQVPIMGLLAVYASVNLVSNALIPSRFKLLLVLGLSFASAFGSPLLEKWMTNGQDRFWTLKKDKVEVQQLREVAKAIELMDPQGKTLLTQDLYLAIETNRKVPEGLEMGPFAMLSDEEWKSLLTNNICKVAALSGYTFAIDPPSCTERPIEKQMEYWTMLKNRYHLKTRVENFGQNATPLLILERK